MGDARRIAVFYAVWAALCAGLSGFVITIVGRWLTGGAREPFDTVVATLGWYLIAAAGQGVAALLTGVLLARMGRVLQLTLLLGLLVGMVDFGIWVVQRTVPGTGLEWPLELAALAAVAALLTILGSKKEAV